MDRNNSLTEGPILKGILLFTLPVLFGSLFQTFYNMADTIIVGRLLGLTSLAAVGSTGSVYFFVIGFVNGLCAGMAIPVAQRYGAGDFDSLRRYIANTVLLSALFSLLLTPGLVCYTPFILRIMRTPADISGEAALYIAIIFGGIPVTFLYNVCSCVLRAVGDSKTPLWFLILSSVLNILLDILSVSVFGMDVRGPALATVLSQLVSGLLCLVWMYVKYPFLRPEASHFRPDVQKMLRLLSVGVPMGLQYSITAIGSVILAASVNTLGSTAVAAVTVGSRINMFVGNSEMDSLGTAMATYAGQNYGARNYRRIRDGALQAILAGIVYAMFALIIMLLFSRSLAAVFVTGTEGEEVIANASKLCYIVGTSYSMLCILSVLRFSLQGLGRSSLAMLSGVAEMLARTLLGLCFVPVFGFTAACFSNPLAWLFADLTLLACWLPVIRKVKAELADCAAA